MPSISWLLNYVSEANLLPERLRYPLEKTLYITYPIQSKICLSPQLLGHFPASDANGKTTKIQMIKRIGHKLNLIEGVSFSQPRLITTLSQWGY